MARQRQKKTVAQLAQEKVEKQRLAEMVAAAVAKIAPPQGAGGPADAAVQRAEFERQVQAAYAKLKPTAPPPAPPKPVAQLAAEKIQQQRTDAAVKAEVERQQGPTYKPAEYVQTGQEVAGDYARKRIEGEAQAKLDQAEYARRTQGVVARTIEGGAGAIRSVEGFAGAAMSNPYARAAFFAANTLDAVGRADSQPFLSSPGLRSRAVADAIPIVGSLVGAGEKLGDAALGRRPELNRVREQTVLGRIEGGMLGEQRQLNATYGLRATDAESATDIGQTFQLPTLGNARRESGLEKKLYEENVKLLPYRVELTKATKERAIQESRLANVTKEEQDQLDRNRDLQQRLERIAADRKRGSGGSGIEQGVNAKDYEMILQKREAPLVAELSQGREIAKTLAVKKDAEANRLAEADSGVRVGRRDLAQAQFEVAQNREADARGEARRLGSASEADLGAARAAKMVVDQVGYERVGPEARASYNTFFPKSAEAMAQRAGAGRVAEFRALAGPESGDYAENLGGAVRRVDAARKQVEALTQSDIDQTAAAVAEAVKGVFRDYGAAIARKMADDKAELVRNAAGIVSGMR